MAFAIPRGLTALLLAASILQVTSGQYYSIGTSGEFSSE
jgi:hypothetical protein